MTQRPRSHVLGDIAVSKLVQMFTHHGWTSEVISQDYGEDLLVRIFEDGIATKKFFFLQSKSTEDVSGFRRRDGYISYKFKSKHVSMWSELRHPVIVSLYDAKSDTFLWQDIQKYQKDAPRSRQNVSSFLFHHEKVISEDKFPEFKRHIDTRYREFDDITGSGAVLVEELEEKYGLKAGFGQDGVILLPKGRFTEDEDGSKHIVVFGEVAAQFSDIEEWTGLLGNAAWEAILENAITIAKSFEDGGKLQIKDSDGLVVEEFSSLEELQEKSVAKR